MGRPRTNLSIDYNALLAEMRAGKSTRELAKECGVSPGTIRNRLEEYDKEAYTQIASERITSKSSGERIELAVSGFELHEEWKSGKSIKELAEKYKVSRQTIIRRLKEYDEQEYEEIARNKIDESIAERTKKISATPEELFNQFIKGESTATLATKYHVSRQTIARMLIKYDKETYEEIVKERITRASTKKSLIPIDELKKRWENGQTEENLEKASGLNYRTILNKLKEYCGGQYGESLGKRTRQRQNQSNTNLSAGNSQI